MQQVLEFSLAMMGTCVPTTHVLPTADVSLHPTHRIATTETPAQQETSAIREVVRALGNWDATMGTSVQMIRVTHSRAASMLQIASPVTTATFVPLPTPVQVVFARAQSRHRATTEIHAQMTPVTPTQAVYIHPTRSVATIRTHAPSTMCAVRECAPEPVNSSVMTTIPVPLISVRVAMAAHSTISLAPVTTGMHAP